MSLFSKLTNYIILSENESRLLRLHVHLVHHLKVEKRKKIKKRETREGRRKGDSGPSPFLKHLYIKQK